MRKIMVIDDDIINQKITKQLLEQEYQVISALDGHKALRLLSNSTSLPDLILLDVNMPDMNGFEVISVIKNNADLKDIPVIFLTAHKEAAEELEGLRLGAVDYIYKPFVPSIFLKRLEMHLNK